MNEYADSLLKLPGTEEERDWLEERLETLSVKESIVLVAAVERSPPATMEDAVNCLLSLNEYDVYPAGSYEQLGEFYLREQCVSQEQRPYFDKAALGQWYEDEHPGLFVGGCYVAYPGQKIYNIYDGEYFPEGAEALDWSVRLKLASERVPEGVWVKLPDREENTGRPDEIRLALDELKVKTIDECTLLDARCVLPIPCDLVSQYEDIKDLMYDGDSLGLFFDAHRNDSPEILDKFLAVLEFEGCRRLDEAVRISEGLDNYDFVTVDTFMDKIADDLSRQSWAQAGDGVKGCFRYSDYAAALAEQQGYSITGDEEFYIRKRDSPVLELQQSGMTM